MPAKAGTKSVGTTAAVAAATQRSAIERAILTLALLETGRSAGELAAAATAHADWRAASDRESRDELVLALLRCVGPCAVQAGQRISAEALPLALRCYRQGLHSPFAQVCHRACDLIRQPKTCLIVVPDRAAVRQVRRECRTALDVLTLCVHPPLPSLHRYTVHDLEPRTAVAAPAPAPDAQPSAPAPTATAAASDAGDAAPALAPETSAADEPGDSTAWLGQPSTGKRPRDATDDAATQPNSKSAAGGPSRPRLRSPSPPPTTTTVVAAPAHDPVPAPVAAGAAEAAPMPTSNPAPVPLPQRTSTVNVVSTRADRDDDDLDEALPAIVDAEPDSDEAAMD